MHILLKPCESKKRATVCLGCDIRVKKESKNLNEEQALRLQVETHAMSLVIQEVLQPQELHTTQRPPVSPVQSNFQLPGLNTNTHTYYLMDIDE